MLLTDTLGISFGLDGAACMGVLDGSCLVMELQQQQQQL